MTNSLKQKINKAKKTGGGKEGLRKDLLRVSDKPRPLRLFDGLAIPIRMVDPPKRYQKSHPPAHRSIVFHPSLQIYCLKDLETQSISRRIQFGSNKILEASVCLPEAPNK